MNFAELCPTCLRPASLRKAAEIDIYSRQAEADRLNALVASMEAAVCHAVGVDPVAVRVAELEADSKRLDWLLRRGVAWRDCHNDWWREGEWLYESGNPRSIIDEAMEAKP